MPLRVARRVRYGVVFFTDIQGTVCELNIHRGNTVVQVTLAYEDGSKLPGGDGSPRFPEV